MSRGLETGMKWCLHRLETLAAPHRLRLRARSMTTSPAALVALALLSVLALRPVVPRLSQPSPASGMPCENQRRQVCRATGTASTGASKAAMFTLNSCTHNPEPTASGAFKSRG